MKRSWRTLSTATAVAVCAAFVAACGADKPPAEEVVRAIKHITVSETAGGQVRNIAGVVEAKNRSALSFRIGGKVTDVRAKLGDKVTKGYVLAALDDSNFQISVRSAEAELRRAKAEFADKREKFSAQKRLYEKQIASKSAFDRAKADFEAAESTIESAKAQLELAKRDVLFTLLRAPIDGVITKRDVEPFEEKKAGEVVFEIEGEGGLEVQAQVPESIIKFVKKGAVVDIKFPTHPGITTEGVISEVGSRAEEANSFPVTVNLSKLSGDIRAGASAEIAFKIRMFGSGSVLLIPVTALLPSDTKEAAYVYVYDKTAKVVKKTRIKAAGVQGSLVQVHEGLKPGDIIAVAGVSFLHDGQKVRLWTPPAN